MCACVCVYIYMHIYTTSRCDGMLSEDAKLALGGCSIRTFRGLFILVYQA